MQRFVSTLFLSFLLASPVAIAADARDVAKSEDSNAVIRATNGTCVRTKWQSSTDICAPTPPPAPAPVAQPAPPPPPAPSPAAKLVLDERTIYFDFNKTALTAESTGKLDTLAAAVKQSPDVKKATILGYTDDIGRDGYNNKLSQKRAAAVNAYLASRVSVPTDVLMVAGKGATNSVTNCPKSLKRKERIACLAKDRRVEIEFNYVQ